MMRVIHTSASFLLVFLILFSTTGIAVYHHICGCPVPAAKTIRVAESAHACCHHPEPAATTSGITPGRLDSPPGESCCSDSDHRTCDREHPDRCSNEVTYLRAPIISTIPVEESARQVPSFSLPDPRLPDTGQTDEKLANRPFVPEFLIPPRAGGSLVIFLHSIKIPFPENLT